MAELSEDEGAIDSQEGDIIENLMKLDNISAEEVMTPRSVIFSLSGDDTVGKVVDKYSPLVFSRIPIFKESLDQVIGFVHRYDLVNKQGEDQFEVKMKELMEPVHTVKDTDSVSNILDQFVKRRQQIFIVEDEFGTTTGLITLEDAIETLLGVEIVDEHDNVVDMRKLATAKLEKREKREQRERIKNNGIRNCTLTTVAPTGSGAIVARVTSGVEPIFATSYKRMVKKNDGGYGKEFDQYTVYHPIIKELFGTDEDLPEYVTTSHKIDPFFRVKMQGTVQKYIDSSISSTVNLKEDTSINTVADIYMKAYENGLKGITVYREGSREGILITNDDKDGDKKPETKLEQSRVIEGQPRLRPTQTAGSTRRIKTGEGTLYITINEDEQGLCEVFTTIGKAGGNAAAQSEAISRLISLALRSGVNPQSIVRQLKGISGPNPTWEDGRLILSTPDAIGKALDDYLHEKKQNPNDEEDGKLLITMDTNKDEKLAKTIDPEMIASAKLMMCKSCDSRSVVNEGGCLTCQSCGWSKCD